MDLTNEEFLGHIQLIHTQQQQQIDILMLILKNKNAGEAEFLDWAHNSENVFLSELSEEEFMRLQAKYEKEQLSGPN